MIKKSLSEFFGALFLVVAIVGSGIMATNLTKDTALQLLINALSAVAILSLIISTFNKVSGAHFNPLVTIYFLISREISLRDAFIYIFSQLSGAFGGAFLANAMFDLQLLQFSNLERGGLNIFIGEVLATFGLIFIIALKPTRPEITIPLWIFGAYFFTSSTSFANPAVTFGRIFSDTYAGIAPQSLSGFVIAQCLGASLAIVISRLGFKIHG